MTVNTTIGPGSLVTPERSTDHETMPKSIPAEGRIAYEPIDDDLRLEDVQMYNLGGHHPVHLDDVLDGRFEVVHKLGNGGFGIVWLCRDITSEKWRAVKIMAADYSSRGVEEKIFNRLRSQFTTNDLDEHHITIPLERFWLEGPNGRHLCLVMPILGMDVSNWRLTQRNVHEQMVTDTKRICRQAIKALRFLHEQGICHGDFKPANTLMKIEGIDNLSKEQIIEMMGEPDLIEIETVSGSPPGPRAPEYCVVPADRFWCQKMLTKSIAIIDFGESFFTNNPPKSTGVPNLYAAPEIMFRTTCPGTYSDIWSLACFIFEICAGDPLFASYFGRGLYYTLGEVEFYLGALPEPYRTAWWQKVCELRGRSYSDENSSDTSSEPNTSMTELEPATRSSKELMEERKLLIEGSGYSSLLEARLGKERRILQRLQDDYDHRSDKRPQVVNYRYPPEYVLELSNLLRLMLKYDPVSRISIKGVTSHAWVKYGV